MNHSGQEKVQRAETQDGKDVRCVNDERILCNGENRRDGIHGEDQVGGFHHHKNNKQWGCHPAHSSTDCLLHEKFLAVIVVGDRPDSSDQSNHRVRLRFDVGLLLSGHSDSGEDQEGPEEIDEPVKLFDQGCTQTDHGTAHN